MQNNKRELELDRKISKERLDLYGKEWSENKDTMEKEAKRQLFMQITEEAIKLFSPNFSNGDMKNNEMTYDALVNVLMEDVFCKFDLEKSSEMQLSQYISRRLKWEKIDIYRSENGKKSTTDNVLNKITKYSLHNSISLDTPIDEEGELNLSDTIEAEWNGMENLEFSINAADIFEMIVAALRTQRLREKAMEFYRVIYTADIISAEKGLAAKLFQFQHQRMIDEELSGGFVDYCMADKCEGIKDIYYTALKLYGEVVADTGMYQEDEPIPLPMEDKVGVAFLKTSKGNYSKHHSEYKKLIASIQK